MTQKTISMLTLGEWCDYWAEGNTQYLEDGRDFGRDGVADLREAASAMRSLIEERDRLLSALQEIAAYDRNSPHGEGICHYGCDTPLIAKTALGIECDVPSEVGDCR